MDPPALGSFGHGRRQDQARQEAQVASPSKEL